MADLNTIKNWFRTGLKPTQEQFWATWDSFRHKGEGVPASDVAGLDTLLLNKVDTVALNDHANNVDSHSSLFAAKEDKASKGVAGGYAPLDMFIKVSSTYLNIVNNLITGGTESLLSAEQGKLLKAEIDAINTLLTSNDVNLDTVQELVNAIKTVEMSLTSILINDLTTGGTTKALTAEMGKFLYDFSSVLSNNKVDKVAGERLIKDAEITKLGQQSGTNTGDQDLTNYALKVPAQYEITTSTNALPEWNGAIVIIKGNVTITIPAVLPANYTFEGIVESTYTVTWAITAPKIWKFGAPTALTEKTIFTLLQSASNPNDIYLLN